MGGGLQGCQLQKNKTPNLAISSFRKGQIPNQINNRKTRLNNQDISFQTNSFSKRPNGNPESLEMDEEAATNIIVKSEKFSSELFKCSFI